MIAGFVVVFIVGVVYVAYQQGYINGQNAGRAEVVLEETKRISNKIVEERKQQEIIDAFLSD